MLVRENTITKLQYNTVSVYREIGGWGMLEKLKSKNYLPACRVFPINGHHCSYSVIGLRCIMEILASDIFDFENFVSNSNK